MRESFKDHFGKEKPENDALGHYKAARDVYIAYAKANDMEFKDEETANLYAEACERQVGNFAHGFAHKMEAGETSFTGRLEAWNYSNYTTYGHVEASVEGPKDLVDAVKKAWEEGKPVTNRKFMHKYTKGKLSCYGLCKRR